MNEDNNKMASMSTKGDSKSNTEAKTFVENEQKTFSENEDSDDETSSGSELHGFDIDNQLEEKLKKHGLNRRNVKTIIHELLNDEHVRGLLKANLDNENAAAPLPESKNLRSKVTTKRSKEFEKVAKFTEIPLPEEDDDDEEYHPGTKEYVADAEISQDTQESPNDLDTSIECSSISSEIDILKQTEPETQKSFLQHLDECQKELDAINRRQELHDQEIIAQRTRSKHSLLDIAMAEIETAFKPPDVTDDMYTPSGDDDWHKWLAELMLDETALDAPDAADDDCEQDPDYNFIQSESEECNEKEDYRNDHGTHIPRKEVKELLEENHSEELDFKGQLISSAAPTETPIPSNSTYSKNYAMPMVKPVNTVKSQLAMLRKSKVIPSQRKKDVGFSETSGSIASNYEVNQPITFTKHQLNVLSTQMRQHVQLLTQTNILTRNIPCYSSIVVESHAVLKELQQLSQHDRINFVVNSSYFDVPGLAEALKIASTEIPQSEPVTRLSKTERQRFVQPMRRAVGELMAKNPLFAFSQLLPVNAPQENIPDNTRLSFNSSEDSLMALGIAQMEGHALPWHILIHQYMMPCKQPEQIRSRMMNVKIQGRYSRDNPIRLYRQSGKLPSTPALCQADAGHGTNAENLLNLKKSNLPDWLIALQHETEHMQNNRNSTGNIEKLLGERSTYSDIDITKHTNEPSINTVTKVPTVQPAVISVLQQPSILFSPQKPLSIVLPTGVLASPAAILTQPQLVQVNKPATVGKFPITPQNIHSKTMISNHDTKQTIPAMKTRKKTKKKIVKSNHQKARKTTNNFPERKQKPPVQSKNVVEESFDDLDDEILLTEEDFDENEHDEHTVGVEDLSEDETLTEQKIWSGQKRQADRSERDLKTKWKKRKETTSKKLGGRLHRLHPGLSGKKKTRLSSDPLSRSLLQSAQKVKLLEEETIVQLDPSRVEKEMLLAEGYLTRMEDVLKDHPNVLTNVLEIFSEFDGDTAQSPPGLFKKLSKLLAPWPELLQGFAPFLLPEQAQLCGLLSEQQVYARARKFLRQLEIRFQDNPQHLGRILNAFHSMSSCVIFNEHEVKNTILALLKSEPYLQEEFLMFFDNERPPESRLHGECEEIFWNDDLIKDSMTSKFERVIIPFSEGQEVQASTSENFSNKTDEIKSVADHENKSDSEEDPLGDNNDMNHDTNASTDIGIISEDALSCSPFKRLIPATTLPAVTIPPSLQSLGGGKPPVTNNMTPALFVDVVDRPVTPTGIQASTDDSISVPSFDPINDQCSSQGLSLPLTPSHSKSSLEAEVGPPKMPDENDEIPWNREEDTMLLSVCKQLGPTEQAFHQVAQACKRTVKEATNRFNAIMALLSSADQTDTDTTGQNSDSDTDTKESNGE
ncbi:unnamed protein product [Clavelina lepadiformis]|uniref:Myb-like domain-containing protein n=1 Tax=Clavelina lepadiformis TaxID=159417 RepID=A0ABP0FSJ3_CLALP